MYDMPSTIAGNCVGVENFDSWRNDTVSEPSLPCLVVTEITPLAPFDPYSAAAVASYMIENDSMLSGSTRARSFADTSKPSRRMSGLCA